MSFKQNALESMTRVISSLVEQLLHMSAALSGVKQKHAQELIGTKGTLGVKARNWLSLRGATSLPQHRTIKISSAKTN